MSVEGWIEQAGANVYTSGEKTGLRDALRSHLYQGRSKTRKNKEKIKDKSLPMLLDAEKETSMSEEQKGDHLSS